MATEYRWAQLSGTFGESAELAGRLAAPAFGVAGAAAGGRRAETRPPQLARHAKHLICAGPETDGDESHFAYGQD